MQQPQQKFVMGWATQFMMSNMLKYGNNNIILDGSTAGIAHVTSMQDVTNKYHVTGVGTATLNCSCPQGQLHYISVLVKDTAVLRSFRLWAQGLEPARQACPNCTAMLPERRQKPAQML